MKLLQCEKFPSNVCDKSELSDISVTGIFQLKLNVQYLQYVQHLLHISRNYVGHPMSQLCVHEINNPKSKLFENAQ